MYGERLILIYNEVDGGIIEPKTKKAPPELTGGAFFNLIPQRPTLPYSYPYSTIGPEELNFRVRNGNGCGLLGMTTGSLVVI